MTRERGNESEKGHKGQGETGWGNMGKHYRQGRHEINAKRGTWGLNRENPDKSITHTHINGDTERGAQRTKTQGNLINKELN